MLYHRVRAPFWRRHPWLTGAAAAVACWLLIQGSYVIVAVAATVALLIFVRRRRRALTVRNAGLRARADYEHWLGQLGDPRGFYGRYPPVPLP